ncbi:abhydrolase domain-containing protein 6 [Klebsormidium nitens]|uniref:Abhydrolase domain-containing protein 6 n=1 Tax=Klebsormidium nitens TaxID=105231 RepID=A0A1Y1I1R6_KLENI|nr:abhydrolase domain-containing protein 6 [Klebsormidium nitens]|eukprot:GAQ82068.1 abhydrolase domain-containing protein 6 [Klebsormidium nitens]
MVWPGALHASGEPVHRRFVQVKEKRCFFTDTGKGPLVVILSSQLVLSRSYRWTAEVLSQNFRVVVVEMPGCGNSDSVSEPWSNSQYAEWVSNFLTALKVDEAAALVGHSDSGAPALEAAVRFPQQIKNLILVDSIGANAPDSLPRLILMRMADAASEIRFSVPGLFHAGKNALFHTRNWLNQIRISAVYDLTDQAKQVKVPTLLAWGRRDKTIPLSAAGTFFRLIPNSHVYISDDGSHNWLIQRPEEFCQAVTEFVHRKDKTSTFTIQLASGVFQREKTAGEATALAANGSR